MNDGDAPLGLAERFGITPLGARMREAALALGGDPYTPASRFGVSSLSIMRPRLSLRMWKGRVRADRRAPIYNYFNRTPTPVDNGWSTRVTQVRDYRGGRHTYDSHNGTDFAVPVGTVVVAAAPGRVARVSSEFNRGGLKVVIDHGGGLITTSVHLGRALVERGQDVARGQPVALSGASGLDMVAMFPWSTPHVHYNVWLNGEAVDPFAIEGEVSLWRGGNSPVPCPEEELGSPEPSTTSSPSRIWDEAALARVIASCRDPILRDALAGTAPIERRAVDTIFHGLYYPTRFGERPFVYSERHPRRPILDLPLRAQDYVGAVDEDDEG